MAQETELWERETSTQADFTEERKKDESATGRDMPSGDGQVADEQVNALSDDRSDRPTGQDHSTENHERQKPSDGVGAVQDSNLIGSGVADVSD
jgi:hypothetical protein